MSNKTLHSNPFNTSSIKIDSSESNNEIHEKVSIPLQNCRHKLLNLQVNGINVLIDTRMNAIHDIDLNRGEQATTVEELIEISKITATVVKHILTLTIPEDNITKYTNVYFKLNEIKKKELFKKLGEYIKESLGSRKTVNTSIVLGYTDINTSSRQEYEAVEKRLKDSGEIESMYMLNVIGELLKNPSCKDILDHMLFGKVIALKKESLLNNEEKDIIDNIGQNPYNDVFRALDTLAKNLGEDPNINTGRSEKTFGIFVAFLNIKSHLKKGSYQAKFYAEEKKQKHLDELITGGFFDLLILQLKESPEHLDTFLKTLNN